MAQHREGTQSAQMSQLMTMALGVRVGLLLQVSDFVKANGIFNSVKKREEAFAMLQFRQSTLPDGNALIIRALPRGGRPKALKAQDEVPAGLTIVDLDL